MGSLLARRSDEAWLIAVRRWTLVAWTRARLRAALLAHWAYVEVGWGGYYAWDPVENAALMPWLAATAFLHSVMIQEKRGMLKLWNMLLVILAFMLSLFGTFLTRSGSSTRSTRSPRARSVLVRLHHLRRRRVGLSRPRRGCCGAHEARIARVARGDVSSNNLLLVALCLTILGRLWPILTEAVRGESSVAGPLQPSSASASAAAADGDRAADRMASARCARSEERSPGPRPWRGSWPWSCSLGAGSSTAGLLAYTFSAFVLGSIGRSRNARPPRTHRSRVAHVVLELVARNRRRYGGYIVHASIVLLAIGVAGSSAYDTERSAPRTGERVQVADYTITYRGTVQRPAQNA